LFIGGVYELVDMGWNEWRRERERVGRREDERVGGGIWRKMKVEGWKG